MNRIHISLLVITLFLALAPFGPGAQGQTPLTGFNPKVFVSSRAALRSQTSTSQTSTLPVNRSALGSTVGKYTLQMLQNEGGLINATYVDLHSHVAGLANLTGDVTEHGAFWTNGQLLDIGTLGGPASPARAGLVSGNRRGSFFVGNSETATADPNQENFCSLIGGTPTQQCLGMVYSPATNTKIGLPPLPGGLNSAVQGATGNWIAGYAENGIVDPACAAPQVKRYEAVLWHMSTAGAMLQARLMPLTGDTVAVAGQVNQEGDAVGTSGTCGQIFSPPSTAHAVIWNAGALQPDDLGSLGGTFNNFAFAINRYRQVTGASNLAGDNATHAFLWQNGKMNDLGVLRPDDFVSFGNTVSDLGAVVGGSCGPVDCHGFYWKNGVMSDLNDLLVAPSTVTIQVGNFINAHGDITVTVFDPSFGDQLAGVLHPVTSDDNDGSGDAYDDFK